MLALVLVLVLMLMLMLSEILLLNKYDIHSHVLQDSRENFNLLKKAFKDMPNGARSATRRIPIQTHTPVTVDSLLHPFSSPERPSLSNVKKVAKTQKTLG